MMKYFFGTLFLMLFACAVLQAQTIISGKVSDSHRQPVPHATITVSGTAVQTIYVIADDAGTYRTDKIPANTQIKITASAVGQKNFSQIITTHSGDNVTDFVLEDAPYLLTPLEVKAVRASDKSPFTKTEIKQSDIAKVNLGQDLPFILNQMPSVVVNSDAGNGIGYTGIRVRGSDASRTNVTINGIPYNDAESQGSYFVDIPDVASSAQSIQVQRGVGTSTNGAGAFGATVNINTNEVHQDAYATLSNSFGTFNSWKNTVGTGTGLINNHWYADVRLSNITSDGYIERASSKLQSLLFATGYVSDRTSVRFNFITGKEKTYQAWNGVPEYMIGTNRRYNEVGQITDSTYYNNQTDNYVQTHYQLFVNQKLSDYFSFNISSFLSRGKGYYEEYKADAQYSSYGLPDYVPFPNDTIKTTDLIRQKWLDNYFYGQTFALQYNKGNNDVTLGGSWTQYDGKHYGNVLWTAAGGISNDYQYYGDLPAHKYDQNVYLKWLHNLNPNWNIYGDLQYRHVKHTINGYDDDPTFSISRNFGFFNPKAGVSYNKNGYNAYFSYAMANKEPGRDDFQAAADQQPNREQLHDFELGAGKVAQKYNWGITLYYMKYKDQLVLTGRMNDVGSYTRINVPNSYRAGIELQGGYTFAQWINLNGNIAFSRNKIKDFTAYYDEYDDADMSNWTGQHTQSYHNTDISFAPKTVSSLILNIIPYKNLELSAIGKYVGKQYLDNTQNETRKLNGYYNQDFRITYTIKPAFIKEISIIGYMYNAWDKMYNTNGAAYTYWVQGDTQPTNYNYYFPMSGTRYAVGINIKL